MGKASVNGRIIHRRFDVKGEGKDERCIDL